MQTEPGIIQSIQYYQSIQVNQYQSDQSVSSVLYQSIPIIPNYTGLPCITGIRQYYIDDIDPSIDIADIDYHSDHSISLISTDITLYSLYLYISYICYIDYVDYR